MPQVGRVVYIIKAVDDNAVDSRGWYSYDGLTNTFDMRYNEYLRNIDAVLMDNYPRAGISYRFVDARTRIGESQI